MLWLITRESRSRAPPVFRNRNFGFRFSIATTSSLLVVEGQVVDYVGLLRY